MTDPGSILQLASALLSVIKAVDWTVEQVKKLQAAKNNATALSNKVNHLAEVLKSINNVLEGHENRRERADRRNGEIYRCLEGCFRACHLHVTIINERIEGLVKSKTVSLGARFGFVSGEKEIRSHEATIEGYLQMSQLCLIQLNGVSSSANHETTHRMLERNRRALEDILRPYLASVLSQSQPAQVGMDTDHSRSKPNFRTNSLPNVTTVLMLEGREVHEVPLRFSEQRWDDHGFNTVGARAAEAVDHIEIDNEVRVPAIGSVVDMPLAIAVKKNDAETVKTLMDEGADLTSIIDAYGWTLLHHVVFKRHEDSLAELLKSPQVKLSSFINVQNDKGHTALMICAQQASRSESRRIARLLIENDASINIEDECGRTALYFVVEHAWRPQTEKFVQVLLANGATFGRNCGEVPHTAKDYDSVGEALSDLERVDTSISTTSSREHSSQTSTHSSSHRSRRLLPELRRRRDTR